MVQAGIKLAKAFVFAGIGAEGHGAEAESADIGAGPAELGASHAEVP